MGFAHFPESDPTSNPTTGGLAAVDPHDPRLAVPDSLPVRVTEVRADGTPRSLDSLRLAPDTYRLAIDFSAISLRHADNLSFRYRLDDGPWTPAHARHTAEFTTLNAGMHQFEVQTTINGETWYTLDAPLRFTVAPHFYETGWFHLLVVLGLLGLAGAASTWSWTRRSRPTPAASIRRNWRRFSVTSSPMPSSTRPKAAAFR